MADFTPKIILHGGAGKRHANEPQRQQAIERIVERAYKVLLASNAIDAVEVAIIEMEDSSLFNAGTGSYLQMDGVPRMDASIMKSDLSVGAVANISNVKNPIRVARKVMEETIHVLLVGELAKEFAREMGFPSFDVRTEDKMNRWVEIHKEIGHLNTIEHMIEIEKRINHIGLKEGALGTVGAVAIDKDGNICAGTSTGGLLVDLPGRVGDTPLVGCGTYANRVAGASVTGTGERIMQVVLAKKVVDLIEQGLSAQQAVEQSLEVLKTVKGRGGVVCIDKDGNLGYANNTERMTFAFIQ